ncbi:MAG: mechanosensitive ion channel [Verrucomicrobiota bacterium]|nr:mechanosensitive ion channel [Verrucomicrobiota bacterium]
MPTLTNQMEQASTNLAGSFKIDDLPVSAQLGRTIEAIRDFTTIQVWFDFFQIFTLGLLLGLLIVWFSDYLMRFFVSHERTRLSRDIVKAVRWPLAILVFSYFLSVGVDILYLPGWLWNRIHFTLFPAIYGLAFLIGLFRMIDVGADIYLKTQNVEESDIDEQLVQLLVNILKVLVILIVGVFIINAIVGLDKVIPLLTGLGFLGAALALAAQHTLANVFASISILFDRIFKVGDRIRFGDYDGFVLKTGLRSIKLSAMTGEIVTLPNREIADRQVRNLTSKGASLIDLAIGLPYSASRKDIERAIAVLSTIYEAHPQVVRHTTLFSKLGDYSLDLKSFLYAKYKNSGEFSRIVSELNLEIKEKFDEAGLSFAFPTQTIEISRSVANNKV